MTPARRVRRLWRGLRGGPPSPGPDAVLVLRRPGSRWARLGRAWVVEMDGARVATLRAGGERRVPVPSGRRRLHLWAGDVGSLPLTLTLARGEEAVIEAMTMRRAVRLGLVDAGFAPDPLLLRRLR